MQNKNKNPNYNRINSFSLMHFIMKDYFKERVMLTCCFTVTKRNIMIQDLLNIMIQIIPFEICNSYLNNLYF